MYTLRNIPISIIFRTNLRHIARFALYLTAILLIYTYVTDKVAVPFLPISMIGIAVSFYIGFKNSASNERINEARKNWGTITNESRSFGSMLHTYIPETHYEVVHQIIKRHIAWLYMHKYFLRFRRMEWEHNRRENNDFRQLFISQNQIPENPDNELDKYLSPEEKSVALSKFNPSAHLLHTQSLALKSLEASGAIGEFRLYELQQQINKLYTCQGINERIKTFPFQRQYANFGKLFVRIFIFLFPLGLLNEFKEMIWLMPPFALIVFYVFFMMEMVGDYSENPFEGLINDVPITAITRNIEIELLQMIGAENIPAAIQSKNGVLM